MVRREDPGSGLIRIPLEGVRRWPWRAFATMALVAAVVIATVAGPLLDQGRWDALVLIVAGLFVLPVFALILTRWCQKFVPEIVLGPDRVLLPLPQVEKSLHARYRDIEALFLRHDPRRGFLWIGTAGATLVYPLGAFAKPSDARHLCEAIRQQIQDRVPEGSARLAAFDDQQHTADRAYGRRLLGLKTVLAFLLAALFIEEAGGAGDRLFALERFGAHAPALVRDMGHWWRLFSANLLHRHVVHALVDGAVVLLLGSFLERLIGARTFLVAVMTGGVLGQLAILISDRAELVAGSAPFGTAILGAFAFTLFRNRGRVPLGFSPSLRTWLWVGMLLGASLLIGSSHAFPGYLGGFLGGVLVAAAALDGDPTLPLGAGRPSPFTAALVALAAVWIGALGSAVNYGITADSGGRIQLIENHLAAQRGSSTSYNRLAWEVATDPDAGPRELELAHTAIRRAVERNEGERAFRDTLATVEYRIGKVDSAIERERALLLEADDGFFAGQLARFLVRRRNASGIRFEGMEPWRVDLEFESHPSRGLRVRGVHPSRPGRMTVYVLAMHDDALAGLLRFHLAGEGPAAQSVWLSRQGIENVFPSGTRFVPAMVVAGREPPRAWLLDERVRDLP